MPTLPAWRNLDLIEQRASQHYVELPYHGFPHALETRDDVRAICEGYAEQGHPLTPSEQEDAEIGALYHDAGFYIPIHKHGFKSKEAYARHIMAGEQRELGMPEYRISRIGGAILSTQLHVPPKTRVAKVLRQADLSTVARRSALRIVRDTVNLFQEDEILKRFYDHPGEIKTDIVSFVINSAPVLKGYNSDDVSLGEFDYDPNGKSPFANGMDKGIECFLPERARSLLRQLKILPQPEN